MTLKIFTAACLCFYLKTFHAAAQFSDSGEKCVYIAAQILKNQRTVEEVSPDEIRRDISLIDISDNYDYSLSEKTAEAKLEITETWGGSDEKKYKIYLTVSNDTDTVTFFQNRAVVIGVGPEDAPSEAILGVKKKEWIQKAEETIPLPDGAKLETYDLGEHQVFYNSDPVPVVVIRYLHMISETSEYIGDYIMYMLNPKTGALYLYNRKWEKDPF